MNWSGNAQVKLVWSLSSGAAQTGTGQQTTAPSVAPITGEPWTIEYFNNVNLDGAPVATEQKPANGIARNYGTQPPVNNSGIGADNWAARWKRNIDFTGGQYTFTLRADDGARVWIGDTQIINQPEFLNGVSFIVHAEIPAGRHLVIVEHFDIIADANIFLTWDPPLGTNLRQDGCNSEVAGINGSAPPCSGTAGVSGGMYVTVRAGPLYFRPGPSQASGSIQMIHRGEQYAAVGRSGDNVWVQLNVNGRTGWSMTQFLTLAGDINTLPVTDGSAPVAASGVTNPSPGSSFPGVVVTAAGGVVYDPFNSLQQNTGGTPLPVVTAVGGDAVTIQITATPSIPLVQARALGNMRIRTTPGTAGDRVGGVGWGEVVTVIGRTADGRWLQIEVEGIRGWSAREWYEVITGDLNALPVTG